MLFLLPQAAILAIFLTLILNNSHASAEIAISLLPLFLSAGQCGQSCAAAVSSIFSTVIGCPLLNPADCLCSLAPEALMAAEASACCRMSCTATSYTATGYALPSVGQNLISSYCQVNGFVTPTKLPDPATLVATSELSKLPITKAQPSISLASSTLVLPATSTTSNFTSSLEPTATSFESTNVVYTSTSQFAQSSSTGTTSTNVASSTSAGLGRLTVVLIVAFAVIGLVLIIFVVLLRRHLRSIFCQIRSSFNTQGKRNDEHPEVCQPTSAFRQTSPIVNANYETGSTISHVNGERLSADGWTVSTSSDRPEKKIWTQGISLFSKHRNGWVPAMAKIDTGTRDNWIHPKLVKKWNFPTESVAPRSFQGYAETFTCDSITKITWQSMATHKQLETIFNVGHEDANFQVLLGLDFAINQNLFRVNSEPHVFNIEDLLLHAG